MTHPVQILCRAVAVREPLNDGNRWSFYLVNDGDAPIDSAVLTEVAYEYGNSGNSDKADVRLRDLAPRAHALVWRDDGSGAELRMDLVFDVRIGTHQESLRFEFPKLYRLNLLPIRGLNKLGWEGILLDTSKFTKLS